jgi:hypothetical protein
LSFSLLGFPFSFASQPALPVAENGNIFGRVESFFANVWQDVFSRPAAVQTTVVTQTTPPPPMPTGKNSPLLPLAPAKPSLPKGDQTYRIVQGQNVWPKILTAQINPVDVEVGNTQTFNVTIETPVAISAVEAIIQTDHGSEHLMLKKTNFTTTSIISSPNLYLNQRNQIVLGQPRGNLVPVAEASQRLYTENFSGSWQVKDTHNATYHTTFLATDVLGRSSSVTLAWSDACGIPNGGSYTLSSNCTISSVDGVDNGNFIVASGYTITLDSTFAFNPGQSITVNGSIAFGSGGQIEKTYLWMIDADGDSYAANSTEYAQTAAPTGGRRRYLLVTGEYDCNDSSSSIYPGIVTSVGACGSCSYSSACTNSGSGTDSYTECTASGVYQTYSGSCSCSRNTNGASCGSTSCGAWGSCVGPTSGNGSALCNGTQTQTCNTYACSSGSCVASSYTNSQSCYANQGAQCYDPTTSCASSNSVTQYISTCSNGSCVTTSDGTFTCTCGCSNGACNQIYTCSRCSNNVACSYATFDSCSSSCGSPFNISYSQNNGCTGLCGGKGCCSGACCP